MKKWLFSTLIIFFLFIIYGCKDKEDDIIPPQNLYSFEDFYIDFLMYEEHLNAIVNQKETSQETMSSYAKTMSTSSLDDWLTTIEREDILNAHYASNFDKVHDTYYEQLLTTRDLVQTIKTAISGNEDIELNQDFIPETLSNATFRFIKSSKGHILIDALMGTEHTFLKLSLHENLLDYQQFTYYYDISQEVLGSDVHLNFNYFKFLENKDAVYINQNELNASLSYVNIELDEEFTISVGSEIVESEDPYTRGYVISRFDRETNSQTYLDVVNEEIIGETYDIFDEYGGVYRYDDHDVFDDKIRLQVNFVTATGWDYVVVSDASDEEIDAATGVFLNDGTKIYDGWFNYTYTPTYGFLGLWIDLNSKEELTDSLFSLNQYQMNLDHPKATLEFFNQVDLNHFSEIKETFQIENLDMFAQDLDQELYQYIDEDIRLALEGKNNLDVPEVPLGDFEAFQNAMNLYGSEFEKQPQYVASSNVTTTLKDENGLQVSSSIVSEYIHFDLNTLFFRYIQSGQGIELGYYLDGTKGNLVEYEMEGPTARYHILDPIATEENFIEHVSQIFGEEETNIIQEIHQIDETSFDLTIYANHIQIGGVSLVTLYEQMGITGLSGQEIIIHLVFVENFRGFTERFSIDDLSVTIAGESYELDISSTYTETIQQPPSFTSPQDMPGISFYLPKDVDDALFIKGLHQGRYVLEKGVQYLHLWLEPGEYEVAVYGDYQNVENIKVFDEQGNQIPYNYRFEATYEGLYVVEINAPFKQSADIYVRENPSPKFIDFYFEETDGTLEDEVIQNGYTYYFIHVPSANKDRLLILDPYFIDGPTSENSLIIAFLQEELMFNQLCGFNPYSETQDTCYFLLPADLEITMELQGYYVGEFGIAYQYRDIPQGIFDNTHQWDDWTTPLNIWLTNDVQQAEVYISINKAGNYELSTYYENFGHSYQDAILFDAEGNELHYDWDHIMYLEPGDYTIRYVITHESGDVFVLCVPTLIHLP